jgi:toxin ParE1/3/4
VTDRYVVVLRREAIDDLIWMRRYIENEAGDEIAQGYIDRIKSFCEGFDILPERGSPREEIRIGLRVVVFEQRVTIAYRIQDKKVFILRVLGPHRNVHAELSQIE